MARTPKKWTTDEDEVLRREVAAQSSEGEVRDWCQIAEKLPGRTNKDCRKRWHNTMAGEFRKGQWTKGEDEQLLAAVDKHGQRWTVVATCVSTRSAEQCAKRWQQSLNPELDRSEWTPNEDRKLIEAVSAIGRQWTQIQRLHFPDRSKNAIKNRYTIVSRKLRKQAQRQSPEGPKQETDIIMVDATNDQSGDNSSEEGDSDMSDRDSVHSGFRRPGDTGHNTIQPSSHDSPSMTEFTARSSSWTDFDPLVSATQPPFLDHTILASSQPPAHDPSPLWLWGDANIPAPIGVDPTTEVLENDLTNLDLVMPDSGRASIVSDGLGFNSRMGADGWPNSETNAVTVKLTLDNPNSETMQSLMKIAIDNKAKFRVERD